MNAFYAILTILPLVPSIVLLLQLTLSTNNFKNNHELLIYAIMACIGYICTNKLIPIISNYTLRKGICGKDLGKRGTIHSDKLM